MKTVLPQILMTFSLLGLVACGKGDLSGTTQTSKTGNSSAHTDTDSSLNSNTTEKRKDLTGGQTTDGRSYTNFIDEDTLNAVTRDIEDNSENRSFAQLIESAKTQISENKILITLKWAGVEKPIVFGGSLIPDGTSFSSELKSLERPDLKMFVNPVDNARTVIEGSLIDSAGHKAKILIHSDIRVLSVIAPNADEIKSLNSAAQSWISKIQKGETKVSRISTAIYPGGRSFYVINVDDGSLQGDLLDTNEGYAKTESQGVFASLGKQIELMGNSDGARGNELMFKVSDQISAPVLAVLPAPLIASAPVATKPQIKVPATPTTKPVAKPSVVLPEVVPPVSFFFYVHELASEKISLVAPPRLFPPPSPILIAPPELPFLTQPSGNSPQVVADPAAHWIVQQILADANQPQLLDYMKNSFSKLSADGTKMLPVKSTYSSQLNIFLSCQDKDAGCSDKQSVVSDKIISTLRQGPDKFPAIWSWISVIESTYNPLAIGAKDDEGLWQMVPGTRKAYLKKDENIWNPEHSTLAAKRYFKDLLKMWNGDVKMAVASYNRGQGTLAKVCNKNLKDNTPCDINMNLRANIDVELQDLKKIYDSGVDFWHLHDLNGRIVGQSNTYLMNFISGSVISFNPKAYGYDHNPINKN